MSFLASIGNIMADSGFKEAFCALTGHAFSRSVRGHLLVQAALATIIFKRIQLTDNQKVHLDESHEEVGRENLETLMRNSSMTDIHNKFAYALNRIENHRPTSQLWV